MEQVITEIDGILRLLESSVPASLANPENAKLEKALKNDVAKYFKAIEQAFPYDALANLYFKNVKQE